MENHRKNLVEEKRKQEQESLQQKIEQGVQQLEALAAHINALVTQLETETLKFKKITVEVNRCYHVIQQSPNFKVMGWIDPPLAKAEGILRGCYETG